MNLNQLLQKWEEQAAFWLKESEKEINRAAKLLALSYAFQYRERIDEVKAVLQENCQGA